MNCTRVLQAFGGRPPPSVPPVAVCLSLGRQKPVHDPLASSSLKPAPQHFQLSRALQRNSFHSLPSSSSYSSSCPSAQLHPGYRSCLRRVSAGGSPNKKRVVFADAKGLALTVVHLFTPEAPPPPSPSLQPEIPPLSSPGQPPTADKAPRPKLRLGFPPPLLDPSCFLSRLRDNRVQLESCKVSDNTLSGRVRVLHASPEKAVRVRVTFDSWRSHRDVPCTFLQQHRLGATDTDVFTFDLSLPKNTDPEDGVQFCVFLRPGPGPGSAQHWDDNRGQNYRLHADDHFWPPALSHLQRLRWWNVRCCAQKPDQQRGLAGRTTSLTACQTRYVVPCTENRWDLQVM